MAGLEDAIGSLSLGSQIASLPQEPSDPQMTPVSRLPPEIVLHIFSYLPSRDHLRATLVCRVWNDIATPLIYGKIGINHFKPLAEFDDDLKPEQRKELLATLALLKALENPRLGEAVRYLDHQAPAWPIVPSHAIWLPSEEASNITQLQKQPMEEHLQPYLKTFKNLTSIRTMRIVGGDETICHCLLRMIPIWPTLRKLWLENVPALCFVKWTADGWDGVETGLTHVRLRKLRVMARLVEDPVTVIWSEGGEGDEEERSASTVVPPGTVPGHWPDGEQEIHTATSPEDAERSMSSSLSPFLSTLLPHSPHLTSITLDMIASIADFPSILKDLTFPNLTAFQLRSQTDDSRASYFLSNPFILSFLLRHPKLTALSWLSEHIVPNATEASALSEVLQNFSNNLIWFRSDFSLFPPRYDLPNASRNIVERKFSREYIATFLTDLHFINTLKLQGDYTISELTGIFDALRSKDRTRKKVRKFSLIRASLPLVVIPDLVSAMPGLRELKFCAYYQWKLIRLYPITSVAAGPDLDRRSDFEKLLMQLTPLAYLQTLTVPLSLGLIDISDAQLSSDWDVYRRFQSSSHPSPEPKPIYQKAFDGNEYRIDALGIANYVESLLGNRWKELREIRLLFMLFAREGDEIECWEFLMHIEWEEEEVEVERGMERRGRSVLKGKPVVSKGWGGAKGEVKDLGTRAWF